MNITGTSRESKCMYCDSGSYGKSCPYGPHKLHVHVDDGKRCVWCGSTSTGASCPFNPFGKAHQRGITYNPVMIEGVENGIIQGIVMKKLAQPIKESLAFKHGLIDEHGNTIREPETIEERRALTGVDKYLIKVKNLLEKKLDILNISLYYENKEIDTIEDIEKLYPIELQCKDEIQECVSKLTSIANEYSAKGISISKFEQMIIESLLNDKPM